MYVNVSLPRNFHYKHQIHSSDCVRTLNSMWWLRPESLCKYWRVATLDYMGNYISILAFDLPKVSEYIYNGYRKLVNCLCQQITINMLTDKYRTWVTFLTLLFSNLIYFKKDYYLLHDVHFEGKRLYKHFIWNKTKKKQDRKYPDHNNKFKPTTLRAVESGVAIA